MLYNVGWVLSDEHQSNVEWVVQITRPSNFRNSTLSDRVLSMAHSYLLISFMTLSLRLTWSLCYDLIVRLIMIKEVLYLFIWKVFNRLSEKEYFRLKKILRWRNFGHSESRNVRSRVVRPRIVRHKTVTKRTKLSSSSYSAIWTEFQFGLPNLVKSKRMSQHIHLSYHPSLCEIVPVGGTSEWKRIRWVWKA